MTDDDATFYEFSDVALDVGEFAHARPFDVTRKDAGDVRAIVRDCFVRA